LRVKGRVADNLGVGWVWSTVPPENLEVSEQMWLIFPVIILVDASSF
jgi:hypothetical protein